MPLLLVVLLLPLMPFHKPRKQCIVYHRISTTRLLDRALDRAISHCYATCSVHYPFLLDLYCQYSNSRASCSTTTTTERSLPLRDQKYKEMFHILGSLQKFDQDESG
ncbi:uncharacterized protein LOC143920235 isoform X1 [Arctopsyche grandis]|uniref:uncharacterized protein LOC143920235 isoform X1 n=1 Tax=Arctopsyche grandis TaxID=121162 RepID=UPI00406D93CD